MAASATFVRFMNGHCCLRFHTRKFLSWKQHRVISTSSQNHSTNNATSNTRNEQKDPFSVFAEDSVQKLLLRITGFDMMKLSGPHLRPLDKPVYKLLTDEQLQAETSKVDAKLRQKLQMPPYMNSKQIDETPLSVDPDLADHDASDFVFVDVTFGLKDTDRTVLTRKVDGTLVRAPWRLSERMNQLYNPREGRHYIVPTMFHDSNLKQMISEKKYEYILNRACCQFEPNDPEYVKTCHAVYKGIEEAKDFDVLRSTRHFGPMSFHLTWHNNIDGLIVDMMDRDKLEDAKDLVYLYIIVHPQSQCAQTLSQLSHPDNLTVIKSYLSTDCKDKNRVELSLQSAITSQQSKFIEEESASG